MPEKCYLKPAPGRRLKDPTDLSVVPPEGAWKPRDSYWIRRVRCGDALVSDPPAEQPAAKPSLRIAKPKDQE